MKTIYLKHAGAGGPADWNHRTLYISGLSFYFRIRYVWITWGEPALPRGYPHRDKSRGIKQQLRSGLRQRIAKIGATSKWGEWVIFPHNDTIFPGHTVMWWPLVAAKELAPGTTVLPQRGFHGHEGYRNSWIWMVDFREYPI